MSTNSLIGIMTDNGIRAIYCHYDGYLEQVGAILYQHYKTTERVEALINLGDISVLGPILEPKADFAEPANNFHSTDLVQHSFSTPQKDVTVAYHRDRGDLHITHSFRSKIGFYGSKRIPVPCRYLFKDGQWYFNGSLLACLLAEHFND